MDPFLEDPTLWPGVHSRLVVYIADALQPMIRPRYFAAVEERVYVEGPEPDLIPDVSLRSERRIRTEGNVAVLEEEVEAPEVLMVANAGLEVHEPYIAILDRHSGESVVTIIEVLSPTNKYAGVGRTNYINKQLQVRESAAHLVEIDLLRAGPHVVAIPEHLVRGSGDYDYIVSVNRAKGSRLEFEIYRRFVRQRLPRIRIPLAGDDPDVLLDLRAVLAQTYEAGSYRDRIRYHEPCRPPLPPEDQAWANELIQAAMKLT